MDLLRSEPFMLNETWAVTFLPRYKHVRDPSSGDVNPWSEYIEYTGAR